MTLPARPKPQEDLDALCGNTGVYQAARSTQAARRAAEELTDVIGQDVPIIGLYLDALSYAPRSHLALLEQRNARIVFSPTVAQALLSDAAALRRGGPLDLVRQLEVLGEYGRHSGVVGVYDPETDWLIFPTSYGSRDLRRVVLHELGHALTVKRASVRAKLLQGLPTRMRRHVFSDGYRVSDDPERTLRLQVLEALAEGYVLVVEGQESQLPPALMSDLHFMLTSVDEDDRTRLEFEHTAEGERTASRASERDIVDANDDQEHGALFAPVPPGRSAEPWPLVANDLALRRRRRRRDAA